jgi:hypothetical protein
MGESQLTIPITQEINVMPNTSKTPIYRRKETSFSVTTRMSDERYRNQIKRLADEA